MYTEREGEVLKNTHWSIKMATSGSSEPVVLLQRNFQHLVNCLNMDALLPAALGYGVITDRQRAECASKGDSYAKADAFLGHLVRIVTGDTSKFYTFLKVLDDTGQSAIASRLRGLFSIIIKEVMIISIAIIMYNYKYYVITSYVPVIM